MAWTLYLLSPTDRVRRWLRRYRYREAGPACPAGGYHDARVSIEDGPLLVTPEGYHRTEPSEWPRDDPRWPTHCATCGEPFQADDAWQLFFHTLYRRPDTGAEMTLEEAPPGALVVCTWTVGEHRSPDGQVLLLKLPPGRAHDTWIIDGPSSTGGFWTRTGVPPRLTVRPSILTPEYHGWVTDGVLSDDLEGRRYPATLKEAIHQ